MKTIILCSLILYLNIYAGCKKGGINCKQTAYSFEENYKAYPDLDSIHINDTIWLESNVPTQLKDLSTNLVIDYSGAENLGTAISYLELVGGNFNDPGSVPSANNFDNILKLGTSSISDKPEQIKAYRFIEQNGMYLFKLGIVPKKKGVFAIGPGNAANVYRESDKCTKASFSLTFKDTDQHLYLYEQMRPGYQPSEYERSHGYYFKVY